MRRNPQAPTEVCSAIATKDKYLTRATQFQRQQMYIIIT